MKIQKSYLDKKPSLYLVPTPIGNYDDMTFRAVTTLEAVDFIYCEDTRITKVLLSHFKITTPLLNYHKFNEDVVSKEIIDKILKGSNVALVTDAGTPCISDPGFLVVRSAIESEIPVISLPGPSALITALSASGIESEKFFFYGFLSHKDSQKKEELKTLTDYKETIIFYESAIRIKNTLLLICEIMGNRKVVIAREITKKYEEYIRGNVADLIEEKLDLKGEIVLVVERAKLSSFQKELNNLTIKKHYEYYLGLDYNKKDAMKNTAADRGISKSEVYKELLKK
ncbi:MAG: 16S rRNA (cytidine(1402)-2'-O)-methyltransferase [Bacilli bacterium]|jgi:16S rRNA (cytidine1402-2'-O)-methyltransferase